MLGEDTLVLVKESLYQETVEKLGKTKDFQNQNIFQKLLLIKTIQILFLLPLKALYGHQVEIEDYINLQMEEILGHLCYQ